MNISTVILYLLSIIFLIVSIIKDRKKTKKGIKKGFMAFKKILPLLIPLFLIVGVVLTFVTPEMIKNLLGEDSGWIGISFGLVIGSIAFMPPFVTFPLGSELIANGAGFPQVAAFVTTLMGVGFVYFQAEMKFFGAGSTIRRNSLAFVAAIIVAVMVGVLM
ncbi:MAG: permease [Spirochaetaceae bacterium]|nr:permease [Spirochaetaceae bacterium]